MPTNFVLICLELGPQGGSSREIEEKCLAALATRSRWFALGRRCVKENEM